jgi:alkanesulfonate monooxygenase SsuD/methylene tetrahydromethanopterin reductase-like flavin-dependent oxidoreductase (luciferase family)
MERCSHRRTLGSSARQPHRPREVELRPRRRRSGPHVSRMSVTSGARYGDDSGQRARVRRRRPRPYRSSTGAAGPTSSRRWSRPVIHSTPRCADRDVASHDHLPSGHRRRRELSCAKVAELEAVGADSLWSAGHVTAPAPMREPIVHLARLAMLTKRATVGTAVVALPLYPPAVVAKQVADIVRWTDGRVIFGIGVGGEYPKEFRACGVPITQRGARADEAIPLLRKLWSGERITHAGRYYAMEDVHLDPPPVQPGGPPVVVAGRSDAAVRRAALVGDGWMPYLYSAEKYARKAESLGVQATAAGRDLGSFHWTASIFVALGATRKQARREAADPARRGKSGLRPDPRSRGRRGGCLRRDRAPPGVSRRRGRAPDLHPGWGRPAGPVPPTHGDDRAALAGRAEDVNPGSYPTERRPTMRTA